MQPESENEDDQAMADFEEMTQGASRVRNVNSDGEEVESDEDDDGKRKITYQMDKNKGFIPKRQKKRRNPRVKHRGNILLIFGWNRCWFQKATWSKCLY